MGRSLPPAGFITSTATQNGGQETTVQNALSNVVHHGMIYVPPGYLYGEKEAGAHLLPASASPC